ncbi:MAG: universal stress protein UspA [Desulfobacteraceae bacterium 4484_190.1]|nr:MAG: universal stress protein UspA [Desulfobacteraceae bacterium 4484_190.1]
MNNQLLHVFRNTPFGRETFLSSVYMCQKTQMHLKIYIPQYPQFLMYFSREIVTIHLDSEFLQFPETAKRHAEELVQDTGIEASFLEPKRFTASTLPDIPTDFGLMTCPRTISDISSKIGLGYIGPRVRGIIKNASFPVLIPASVFKEWKNILVFFGGSHNALNALKVGMKIQSLSGLPLKIFTYAQKKPKSHYEEIIDEAGLTNRLKESLREWIFITQGSFDENLYEVPHDALVIVGAYGHGLIKDLLFGSTMEKIQTLLPNSMLIVGPHYAEEY